MSSPLADETASSGSGDIGNERGGQSIRSYLLRDISLKSADLPMLACSFLSGLVDSVAFNAGAVFVSMQTGNTIFVALGASSLPIGDSRLWLRALVSVVAFLAGCSFFAFAARLLGQLRRATLCASFLLQTILVITTAVLAQTRIAPAFGLTQLDASAHIDLAQKHANENHPAVYIVIALLAFQASGQITLSRSLGFNEIPSVVMTSLYCDLLSDPKLLLRPMGANVKRNRRVASVVLFIIGGIMSGWLQRTVVGMPGTLWITAGVKLVLAITWMAWPGQSAGGKTG